MPESSDEVYNLFRSHVITIIEVLACVGRCCNLKARITGRDQTDKTQELMAMGINKIAIYGDFDCGLWIDGIGTDLDDKELPFTAPPELSARFDVWVSDYTSLMLKNEINEAAWLLNEQEGRTLAKEIKKLAGAEIEVVYGPCRESMGDYIAMPEEVME